MVRNILDSVSELSRSFIAEEDGEESSATAADAGPRPEEVTSTKAAGGGSNQRASRKGTARGPGGAAVEAQDSGIGAELAELMQDAELAGRLAVAFPPGVRNSTFYALILVSSHQTQRRQEAAVTQRPVIRLAPSQCHWTCCSHRRGWRSTA